MDISVYFTFRNTLGYIYIYIYISLKQKNYPYTCIRKLNFVLLHDVGDYNLCIFPQTFSMLKVDLFGGRWVQYPNKAVSVKAKLSLVADLTRGNTLLSK